MQKTPLALAIASLAASNFAAADEPPVYQGQEMVVTATRTPEALNQTLQDVTVITGAELSRAGQKSLAEVLAAQPGVALSRTGGLGQPSSVFIRGTESRHALVLVDGVRISSESLGTTALENIPVDQIARIEILRGPGSALYGSDAIGGVIQIFTKKGQGAVRPYLSAGAGSYGTRKVDAGFGGQVGDTRFNFQAGRLESSGISATKAAAPFNGNSDPYRNNNLSGSISHTWAPGHEVGANILASDGTARYDAGTSSDNYNHEQQSVYSVYSRDQLATNWQSLLQLSQGRDNLDINAGGQFPYKYNFATTHNQLTWQNDITVGSGKLMLGAEELQQHITSAPTNFPVNHRNIHSLYAGYRGDFGKHEIQLNGRHDENSQFGSANTGSVAYAYRLTDTLRAKASIGNAFKAPTLNDLYYPVSGNPNLRPERAINREAGLQYTSGNTNLSLVYFDNHIRDLINWVAAPAPAYFAPENIEHARIHGLELAYAGQVGAYRLKASLTDQKPMNEDTGDLLPRRAQRFGTLSANRNLGAWRVGGEWLLVSHRYDASPNNAANRMGGYGLINLVASRPINREWSVDTRLDNIFNKKYELAQGYQTPGATVFVGVTYRPK